MGRETAVLLLQSVLTVLLQSSKNWILVAYINRVVLD
jgi:hypothetical protein